MNTQELIEYVVLGAAGITCFYHAILYIQQRDTFLLLYANYLFSLMIYLLFRRITGYESFAVSTDKVGFVFDYPMVLYMLVSYVMFISKVLSIHENAPMLKLIVYFFYITSLLLFLIHVYKVIFTNECYTTRSFFLYSKLALSFWAFVGLIYAWNIRKTIFIRTIIAGGFAYAGFSLLTIISVYYRLQILGLSEYQLYFIGCLVDILIFSSALGFRYQRLQEDKIRAQKKWSDELEKNKALLDQQHELLQYESKKQLNLLAMHKTLQDEVGASLSSIHLFADVSLQQLQDKDKTRLYIEKIAEESKQLMDNIGDIIWLANLNMEKDLHQQFISRVKDYGQELVQAKQKVCEYKLNPYFTEATLSKEFLKDQVLRIKEAMRMFVEKGASQSLTIIFDCDRQQPFITIVE